MKLNYTSISWEVWVLLLTVAGVGVWIGATGTMILPLWLSVPTRAVQFTVTMFAVASFIGWVEAKTA